MKKSVCLMAILGAFAATGAMAAQQSIQIDFTGTVIEHSCEVSLANGQKQVNLGSIPLSAKENSKGTVVPLFLKLANCGTGVNGVASFDLLHDLSASNWGNTNVGNGTLSTDQKGVVVQFYTSADGATEGKPSLQPGTGTVSGKAGTVLGGYAALKRIGSEKLTAGTVTAKGMFALTYN